MSVKKIFAGVSMATKKEVFTVNVPKTWNTNFRLDLRRLWGLAYRTDYDLTQHKNFSGIDLSYTDPISGKKIVPHVIEPAVGINRLMAMVMLDSYAEDGERVILKLPLKLAPYKAAVFPLLKNKPELVEKAERYL